MKTFKETFLNVICNSVCAYSIDRLVFRHHLESFFRSQLNGFRKNFFSNLVYTKLTKEGHKHLAFLAATAIETDRIYKTTVVNESKLLFVPKTFGNLMLRNFILDKLAKNMV